jgi:glycolate oxidase
MPDYSPATQLLLNRLGDSVVHTDEASRYAASFDNLRYSVLPDAVLTPRDAEDIACILELANEHLVPVTPRGGGTATTGTTTPVKKGWVLDLSSWKQLSIDTVNRVAYAQPGVTVNDLDAAAAAQGLAYPPDPGSLTHATLGGTVATNAGGMRAAKYGVTRDYVLALEGFLPTGEFVRWGSDLRKLSVGFNVRDLWIGSEGSLGIITGLALKLLPRPAHRSISLAAFPCEQSALKAVQALLRGSLTPSALEFLDQSTVRCTVKLWSERKPEFLKQLPHDIEELLTRAETPACLLIELDGTEAEIQSQGELLRNELTSRAVAFSTSSNESEANRLWQLRRSCSQSMFTLGPRKLNEDVVVPITSEIEFMAAIREIEARFELPMPTFGHAADGNFHAHVMFDDANAGEVDRAREAVEALMHSVADLGGAISGEHGIGLAKTPFLHLQHGPAEIAVMKTLKEALDPNGILNPGKIWEPTKPWEFPRESVRLPWDH